MIEPAAGPRCRCGDLALGFLAVTVLSGVALAPLYRPEAALESVEAIEAGLPWAWLLRAVHGFAALGFLLATVAHLVDAVRAGGRERLPAGPWWRSTLLLPLAVLAMLGGFVLRGDAESLAALAVWRGVLETIPLLGAPLATLLLGPPGAGFGAVTAHHAGTFSLLLWLIAADHGRRMWPTGRSWAVALLSSAAIAGVVPLPLGPAEPTGVGLLGPWYLLGLQGMLLDLPPATAWLVPVFLAGGVGALAHVQGRARTATLAALGALLAAWVGWTVRLLLAGAG
ncbi:MAG: cytochrome b N-terminal domain-containing protein [Deltaproteobacteria bacterium]|nr:cytochrome b N-terminal domain-containing protein [Deltaproteobacteria bacterium]